MKDQISQELSISLQDLQLLDQQASKDLHPNQFAAYICHNSNRNTKKTYLTSLDSQIIPTIPMRRVSCFNCRNLNISCNDCQLCHKINKTCCKNLKCLYDYEHWKAHRQDPIYLSCQCVTSKGYSSTTFDIDWRLLGIINKIPQRTSLTSYFYLYYAAGMLWIAQEEQIQKKSQKGKCRNIYYEDNFGMFYFYEKQIKQQNPINLSQSNFRYFTNLLKINVKKFLSAKQTWEVSNLEEECQQIADYFYSHKKLQTIKSNLQNQNQNAYSNMPSLRYQGKFSQTFESRADPKNNYQGCSQFTNQQIIFYYCSKAALIFVRNAKLYEGDTQYSNIRGIRVKFIEKNDNFQKAVWFKDRKGDIFAIYKRSLNIFRFSVTQKCYVQFILASHSYFEKVDSATSLIYIQQKDMVYYFYSRQFKQSFCFSLYRPKNENKGKQDKAKKDELSNFSCTSVNIQSLFSEKQKIPRSSGPFCKALYLMQDYRFKKGKDARKQLVPVIYLLVQKKNYLPMGIGVYKIIHGQQGVIMTQIPSSGPVSQGSQSEKKISFSLGVLFALRFQKQHKLFYYTLDDGKPTLLSAKVSHSDGKEHLNWTDEYLELNGCNQTKLQFEKKEADSFLKVVNFMICSTEVPEKNRQQKKITNILMNDIAGIASNNDFRLIGSNSKTGRIVELYFAYAQGNPSWRIYDLG